MPKATIFTTISTAKKAKMKSSKAYSGKEGLKKLRRLTNVILPFVSLQMAGPSLKKPNT